MQDIKIPKKRGPKPLDRKGFDDLIRRVRSSICGNPSVTVIYVKGKGFKVVRKVSERTESLLDAGYAVKVGTYTKGVLSEHLIEDFVCQVNEIAMESVK